jgi:hypothetical protein
MKKVVLISSFCDTEEKINVLDKNINIIKELNIDVILISPFALPESIINKVDYFFKTKDNPVLEWPIKAMSSWQELFINGEKYRQSSTYADYGWAGLMQVKQLSEFALNFDYEQFFHVIYDLKIDDNVIYGFKSSKKCNIYPSKRNKDIWKVGLHFMIFDRENLKRFISLIHLDSYLFLENLDAFTWLHNLNTVFPYNFETEPVEDEIYFYENYDFYNYSPTENFSIFIVKDDQIKDTVKLLFYNVQENGDIQINVNDIIKNSSLFDYHLFDLEIGVNDVNKVELFTKYGNFDITKKINDVKHNTLRKI